MMRFARLLRALALSGLVLASCSSGESGGGAGPVEEWVGDLDLDIRSGAHVVMRVDGSRVAATITLSDGLAVAPAGIPLDGKGTVYEFPEGGMVLYAAKIAGPPVAGGRCGADPVSLSLTLRRTGGTDRASGGVAAYCGEDTWSGSPVRMLRLSGTLARTSQSTP